MKILAGGDTHGDPRHMVYLFEQALLNECSDVLIVGDYGYWEHLQGGAEFLEVCSSLGTENDMRLYWIDGNHENHTMLRALYGPGGERHKPTPEGFWEIRPNVYYIPRGTRWNWNGVELMGLGGAYSVDKIARLKQEKDARADLARYEKNNWTMEGRRRELKRALDDWGHFSWWPEEEISDEELNYALRDQRPIDILFCHDKPRAANPDWNRKDFPECFPNQDKVQAVVRSLTPSLVVHGHLHHRYEDVIRSSDTTETTVIGLDCNPDREPKHMPDTYIILDLVK